MPEPRYRRRKEDRPHEIVEAAFETFAEKGFAATRVNDVARRAGVSKGLLYLYYKTKEDLFKAVIRNVVAKRIDKLIETVETTELSSEAFFRGPMLDFMKQIPGSPAAVVIRLLLTEGARHPDLMDYYWEQVANRGLQTIRGFVERGVAAGEFRETAVNDMPHLFVSPLILSVVFNLLFVRRSLDTDRLMETHMDMMLGYVKA